MNAPFSVAPTATWVLRVLNGRLAGAERPLHSGRSLTIGHTLDNDIVLRGKGTKDISIALDIADDQARLKVLTGEIMLLGTPVGVGQEAILPPYLPLHIGEFAIAIGGDSTERWTEAQDLGLKIVNNRTPTAASASIRTGLGQRLATTLYPLTDRLPNNALGMWLFILVGLVLIGFAIIAPLSDVIRDAQQNPKSLKAVLATTGFSDLKVTADNASQTVIVSGLVASNREAARLRSMLAQQFPGSLADVTTPEALASAATDILRNNKIDAEAQAGRNGAIKVTSEYLPIDRQNELTSMLKKDLPTLKTVKFQMDGRRGDRDLQYFFSSSGSGLATYVDGSPGYIVTQDQTRWFVGSVVPTGHKILNIGGGRIVFERHGLIEELIM